MAKTTLAGDARQGRQSGFEAGLTCWTFPANIVLAAVQLSNLLALLPFSTGAVS